MPADSSTSLDQTANIAPCSTGAVEYLMSTGLSRAAPDMADIVVEASEEEDEECEVEGEVCWFESRCGSHTYPQADIVIAALGSKLKCRDALASAKRERAVRVVLINLLSWARSMQGRGRTAGISVLLGNSVRTIPRLPPSAKYRPELHIGAKPLRATIALLESEGWLDAKRGVFGRGKATLIEPSKKLLGLLREISPGLVVRRGDPECSVDQLQRIYTEVASVPDAPLEELVHLGEIRMHHESGEKEVIQEKGASAEVLAMYERLNWFNSVNATGHRVVQQFPGYESLGTPIPGGGGAVLVSPNSLVYRRIFVRGSFARSGRYYSKLSNVKRPHRLYMTVDGEQLVERDFKCLHIRLLYEDARLEPPSGDLYDLGGSGNSVDKLPRALIKILMLTMPNQTDRWKLVGRNMWDVLHGEYTQEMRNGIPIKRKNVPTWTLTRKKCLAEKRFEKTLGHPVDMEEWERLLPERWTIDEVQRTVEAIRSAHAPIDHFFGSDQGVKLQAADARIATRVADDFGRAGVFLHILHDGFYCPVSEDARLLESMQRAYQAETGRAIPEDAIPKKLRPELYRAP